MLCECGEALQATVLEVLSNGEIDSSVGDWFVVEPNLVREERWENQVLNGMT